MEYQSSLRRAVQLETKLKILVVEQKIKEAMDFTCLICFEPMDVYLKTPCNHPICKPCFSKSLSSQNGNKCCMCRRNLTFIPH